MALNVSKSPLTFSKMQMPGNSLMQQFGSMMPFHDSVSTISDFDGMSTPTERSAGMSVGQLPSPLATKDAPLLGHYQLPKPPLQDQSKYWTVSDCEGPGTIVVQPQPQHQLTHSSAADRAEARIITGRKRISRACDRCNERRTKCDEINYACEYARRQRKRGNGSRKVIAAMPSHSLISDCLNEPRNNSVQSETREKRSPEGGVSTCAFIAATPRIQPLKTIDPVDDVGNLPIAKDTHGRSMNGGQPRRANCAGDSFRLFENGGIDCMDEGRCFCGMADSINNHHCTDVASKTYGREPYFGRPQQISPDHGVTLGIGKGVPSTPGKPLVSPSPTRVILYAYDADPENLRYPVLKPLLPHLAKLIPMDVACDLLDIYFRSSSSAYMHPSSPFVLAFVFRKRAFLHPTRPRKCQPPLLASMLLAAAQDSDAPMTTIPWASRSGISQGLLDLTFRLLGPLIHTSFRKTFAEVDSTRDSSGSDNQLDNVAAYMHLATVLSASEYKAESLRWWNAAWTLAREIKLGREPPYSRLRLPLDTVDARSDDSLNEHDLFRGVPGLFPEEKREERRRMWWLLYVVDRHTALCFNRPLFLLDAECKGLSLPMDDIVWQKGEFRSMVHPNFSALVPGPVMPPDNLAWPTVISGNCDTLSFATKELHSRIGEIGVKSSVATLSNFNSIGGGIFGYFLPLMAILGEIVDMHHAKPDPRLDNCSQYELHREHLTNALRRRLQAYAMSLHKFQGIHPAKEAEDTETTDGPHGSSRNQNSWHSDTSSPLSESTHSITFSKIPGEAHVRMVVAYGTYLLHVLHIMLAGKWDPIELLDNSDSWISSPSFLVTMGHAVSAAETLGHILDLDPGLEFMPFFLGIYLLQGSFMLLLIADKIPQSASGDIVRACETIVRAHEASIVTLNTEYQRHFSKAMRSALAVIRGHSTENIEEHQQRRRDLLGKYRWTEEGTGIAL